MNALIDALGTVEAERFIASVSRDRFDYTEWRRAGLPAMPIEQLSSLAMRTAALVDQAQAPEVAAQTGQHR